MVKILSERFKKIFENNNPKTKLVSYFVGCYPTPDQSFELIKEAIDNGVSILEIGYCTSEASAEGPVIKAAHDHVLKSGYSLNDTIKLPDKRNIWTAIPGNTTSNNFTDGNSRAISNYFFATGNQVRDYHRRTVGPNNLASLTRCKNSSGV